MLGRLDHQFLNEVSPFDVINPSAENVAQFICEELERGLGDAQAERARVTEYVATLNRWTTLAKGDRADLVQRYGLPNGARSDARLQDRFWVYSRTVNRTLGCTVTYYFKQDTIERVEAEPATCFAAQPR